MINRHVSMFATSDQVRLSVGSTRPHVWTRLAGDSPHVLNDLALYKESLMYAQLDAVYFD